MSARAEWARRMLQTALPSPLQTVALDVCINADDRAFDNWNGQIGTGAEARLLLGKGDARLRRLVSLLYKRFRESDITLEKSLLTWFRTGTVREQFRAESVSEICASAFEALSREGVMPIVVNGVAMANTVYPEASSRHCHDLDLLLEPGEITMATKALVAEGFGRAVPRARASASTIWLSHASGFVIALHQVPYRIHAWNRDAGAVRRGVVEGAISAHRVRIFAKEDALVRILCNGLSAGSRHSPSWAVDAGFLVKGRGDEIDWSQVAEIATSSDRSGAVLVGLHYMKQALRVEVPEGLLDDLTSKSSTESTIRSSVEAARLGAYGSKLGLIRRSRPIDMVRTARWALAARAEST